MLCGVLPFAARAVYIDEHLYLHIAESAVVNDWRFPQDTPWIFFGTRLENLAVHAHPPVGEYCLALMLKCFGPFEEVVARVELVNKDDGKVIGQGVAVSRSEKSVNLGSEKKAQGLAKALVKWASDYYPKAGNEGKK